MDSLAKLMNKVKLNDFDIGTSYWVEITHINNPLSLYVRPTGYKKYLTDVQKYSEHLDPEAIEVGKIVVFKSEVLNRFVRGQVIFVDKGGDIHCDIFAIDHGLYEKSVPTENIFKACHGTDVPPLATHCQLADCKPVGDQWTDRVIDAMKHIIGKERCKMIIRDKTIDSLIVVLINTCPDDVATTLALYGYTLLGYGENIISRFSDNTAQKHYFTFKQLKVDDQLRVRVQSGKSLKEFYVAEVSDYKKLFNERTNITYFSKKELDMQPEDLKKDKPVAVFCDQTSRYERGIIEKITVPETKALVKLIDWGNSLEVDISFMKPMSEKLFYHPATAIFCSAEESQAWDNKLHKFLYPGFEFLITIKEVGDKFEVPNIVNISRL